LSNPQAAAAAAITAVGRKFWSAFKRSSLLDAVCERNDILTYEVLCDCKILRNDFIADVTCALDILAYGGFHGPVQDLS
jgi:hypothetical protein